MNNLNLGEIMKKLLLLIYIQSVLFSSMLIINETNNGTIMIEMDNIQLINIGSLNGSQVVKLHFENLKEYTISCNASEPARAMEKALTLKVASTIVAPGCTLSH